MKKTILNGLVLVLVVLGSIQCSRAQQNRTKAIELNDKAIEFAMHNDDDKALEYYDMAIRADETYYMPHANKIQIFLSRKEYKKALEESEQVIKKQADLAEGWYFTGLLYDYLGNPSKAQSCYIKSVEIYDQRIINPEKQDHIEANRLNRALSLIFIDGREEEGRAELNQLRNLENFNGEMLDDLLEKSKEELMIDLIEID